MNNYEQMREACQKMLDLLMLRGDGKSWCVLTWDEFNESKKMLRAALSAPARQCDVGTAEEQTSRFNAFCMEHHCESDAARCKCKSETGRARCELAWAQMPYEAEEGGAK